MYLKCHRRCKDGKEHRYFSIAEKRRVARGTVERHILYLGEINDSQRAAWIKQIEALDERAQTHRLALFPDDVKVPSHAAACGVQVRLGEFRLHRPRQWGACWAFVRLWQQLKLDEFWQPRLGESREGTDWHQVLMVLVAYRLIDPGSEWRLHREWFERSAMGDLLGGDSALAAKDTLYRCLDKLLAHKDALQVFLQQRWQDLFGASFDVLLYDLTSTYFECDPAFPQGDKRRYGYSRDHRPDCVQVVIALIVTPEGFPLTYEVLSGNTADATTLPQFLERIETLYGKARRIWVMDRGIPTEAHLALMRERGAQYLVGTPKGRLNRLEAELAACSWQQARDQVQVKLLPQDDELYVYVKSQRRVHKERAMRQQRLRRYLARLTALQRQRPHYDTLLTKLGAAQALAGRAASLVKLRLPEAPDKQTRRQRTDFDFPPGSRQAAHGAPARGPLPAALQPHRHRSGTTVAVLLATGGGRSGIQESEKRIVHSPDLPSTGGSHRGAHLCAYEASRLLRARHAQSPTQAARTGAHTTASTRQTRRHPAAGCALSDHRWTGIDLHPLYRARGGPTTHPGATELEFAGTSSATHYRVRHAGDAKISSRM